MNVPTLSPKAKRSATTVGGALSIIGTWLIRDVMGLVVPDYVLVSFVIVIMAVAERLSEPEEK